VNDINGGFYGHGTFHFHGELGHGESEVLARKDGVAFILSEFFPLAHGKIAKREGSDAFADESEGGIAGGSGHAAHLAVLSFPEFEADPGVDDFLTDAHGRVAVGNVRCSFQAPGPAGKAAMPFDDDGSAAQFFHRVFIGFSLDQDKVASTVFVAGVEQLVFKRLFIGKKEESLRIHIEPPKRETFRRKTKILERALVLLTGVRVELAEDSVGFVERDEHGGGGWRLEVGGRRSEVGGRKAEGGRRKAEGGRRKAEGGRRKAEGGRRRAEGGRRKAEGGRRKAEGGRRKAEGGRRRSGFEDPLLWLLEHCSEHSAD
jgi:hypothetical protein